MLFLNRRKLFLFSKNLMNLQPKKLETKLEFLLFQQVSSWFRLTFFSLGLFFFRCCSDRNINVPPAEKENLFFICRAPTDDSAISWGDDDDRRVGRNLYDVDDPGFLLLRGACLRRPVRVIEFFVVDYQRIIRHLFFCFRLLFLSDFGLRSILRRLLYCTFAAGFRLFFLSDFILWSLTLLHSYCALLIGTFAEVIFVGIVFFLSVLLYLMETLLTLLSLGLFVSSMALLHGPFDVKTMAAY